MNTAANHHVLIKSLNYRVAIFWLWVYVACRSLMQPYSYLMYLYCIDTYSFIVLYSYIKNLLVNNSNNKIKCKTIYIYECHNQFGLCVVRHRPNTFYKALAGPEYKAHANVSPTHTVNGIYKNWLFHKFTLKICF